MKTVPNKIVLALGLTCLSGLAHSHGYVSTKIDGSVASRVALCKFASQDTQQKNSDCGAIQWEPQSVEGPDGFPLSGPQDGKIASAGSALATALDEQTADRWVKQAISAGAIKFEWTFTAPHVTQDWRYYITQPNWNANQQLSRDAFDLEPFCVVDGQMQKPGSTTTHDCVVPQRDGYHVILAVWDVGDTAAAFYNVIDVEFDEQTGPVEWRAAGQILPTMDLDVGDVVYTRVFDHLGENSAASTRLTIDESIMASKQWSYALAHKINQTQSQIKAGKHQQNDQFSPQFGLNPIYLHTDSNFKRVEIGYQIADPDIKPELTLSGLQSEYAIEAGKVELALNLLAIGDQQVELTVYNHGMQALASQTIELSDGEDHHTTLALANAQAGHHMLVVRNKNKQGELIEQATHDFMLVDNTPPPSGEYDFIFPQSIGSYTQGTKVMAADGHVYQCKPFPYSGYCKQWTETATQYQPGDGSHWQMAWDKL